ncbi:hypothetical protein ACFWP5_49935, partial [Streptomyces sp. NPDC058469]
MCCAGHGCWCARTLCCAGTVTWSRVATRPVPGPSVRVGRVRCARSAFSCCVWRGRIPGGASTANCWSCVYCFARKSHSYLDLDTGLGFGFGFGFDSQIVVKVNAPDLLRRQFGSRRWLGEHIAMGTNVDCYQRAEGRYRLMPG